MPYGAVALEERRSLNPISWLMRVIRRTRRLNLGIYGPVNSGKTTLANRIAADFGGGEVGSVSRVPHETREVQFSEQIDMRLDGAGRILLTVVDTPGLATKITYRTFLRYGFKKSEALKRAREAAKGVVEAIRSLDLVDAALMVLDSTKDPLMQVNLILLGNLQARSIPTIVVANKIDLPHSQPWKVQGAYPDYTVIPVSALRGTNFDKLYRAIAEVARK